MGRGIRDWYKSEVTTLDLNMNLILMIMVMLFMYDLVYLCYCVALI